MQNVQTQVSQVWQYQDSARLSPDAVVSAIVWHLQPFVRSLQLVIQWICLAGHAGEAIKLAVTRFLRPGPNAGQVQAISEKFLRRLPRF